MIPKTVTIAFPSAYDSGISLVTIIRSLRVLGGIGLKEAKDMALDNPGQKVTVQVVTSDLLEMDTHRVHRVLQTAQQRFEEAVENLRINGCMVVFDSPVVTSSVVDPVRKAAVDSPVVTSSVVDLVRKAAVAAVESNRLDMAGDLLDILRKYQ